VFGKNSSDDIFVDLNAERERDNVCDAWTAIVGIALLQLDDGSDEFPRWSLQRRTASSPELDRDVLWVKNGS
jgi:hypothetical protein